MSQFIKHGDGSWVNYDYNDLPESLDIKSVGVAISLSAIYRNVSFKPSENAS